MSQYEIQMEVRYMSSKNFTTDAFAWASEYEIPSELADALRDAYRKSSVFATKVNDQLTQDQTLYQVVWMRNEHIAFILNAFGRDVVTDRREVTLTDPGTGRPVTGEVLAVGQIDGIDTVIVQAEPGS